MLLVNDGKSQVVELHRVLNQGMGADEDLQLATQQCLMDDGALLLARRAGQQRHLHADGIGHRFDGFQMLPCKNLGGCHDTRLIAVVQRYQCCHKGDNRLAAAHIALQEAVHLLAAAHVLPHLADNAFLGPGERELQHIIVEVMEISTHATEHVSHQATGASLDIMQDIEFQKEQFLKLKAELRLPQRMLVNGQMDVAQCLGKGHQVITLHQFGWQRLIDVQHAGSVEQIDHELVDRP